MKLMHAITLGMFTLCNLGLSGCAPDTDEKTVKVEAVAKSNSSQGILSDAQEKTLKKAHETEELLNDAEKKRLDTLRNAE